MVEIDLHTTRITQSAPARILGIESSCDETAAAVIENGRVILSNVVASQVELHAKYGGVFPEVASRQHIRTIYTVIEEALQQAHLSLNDVDAIAVTRGPGLPGSLVVGMNMAKGLALSTGKPLIGINHLEGHLYSAWLYKAETIPTPEPQFPVLALIVSGGHTELVLIRDHLQYTRLGATLDDAAGEAFDKVARLLGLPYPGGPSVQNAAEGANQFAYEFPRAWLEGTWNFSFSGLKTAVLRQVRALEGVGNKQPSGNKLPPDNSLPATNTLPTANLAASFQTAVVDVLVSKTVKAAQQHEAKSILVAGGVSANKALRQSIQIRAQALGIACHIPALWLCTDNAAMIAAAGYFRFVSGQRDSLGMDVLPNWPLTEM